MRLSAVSTRVFTVVLALGLGSSAAQTQSTADDHIAKARAAAANDFGELLGTGLHFTGRNFPPEPQARTAQRTALFETAADAMAQGLDSIETWRTWPDELDNCVRDALYLCREMQRATQADGAKLVIMFLPSPFVLTWPNGLMPGKSVVRTYALQPADFERQSKSEAQFLAGLREAGIELVDLTAKIAAEPAPPFWHHDLHLSTRGHEIVAEALLPVVDRLLQP